MDKLKIRKTEIIARQMLLYFVDFFRLTIPIFDKARFYRIPFQEYDKLRLKDKIKFSHEMYRLKREGVIKRYIDEKGKFIELTPKGQKLIKKCFTEQLEIKSPAKWDKKWRVVIFDIPEDKKRERDILRNKLERMGFLKLQESVYVYPFECGLEIEMLKKMYFIEPYVQYVLADRIETEIDLLEKFYDLGVLEKQKISK